MIVLGYYCHDLSYRRCRFFVNFFNKQEYIACLFVITVRLLDVYGSYSRNVHRNTVEKQIPAHQQP